MELLVGESIAIKEKKEKLLDRLKKDKPEGIVFSEKEMDPSGIRVESCRRGIKCVKTSDGYLVLLDSYIHGNKKILSATWSKIQEKKKR